MKKLEQAKAYSLNRIKQYEEDEKHGPLTLMQNSSLIWFIGHVKDIDAEIARRKERHG